METTIRNGHDAIVPGLPIHSCSCREPYLVLGLRLVAHGTVVTGRAHARSRRTPEARTAHLLAVDGHEITFVDVERRHD